jgi:cytochrome c-type biogenesis protein CcmH
VLICGLLFLAEAVVALEPSEILSDPVLETRARTISRQLRCVVCQNQSIDDSDAELARDLRILVRERIAWGDSDAQVVSYVVSRYGEFVLMQPPFKPSTYPLWLGPPVILAAGAMGLWLYFRRRSARPEEPLMLSATEQERLREAVGDEPR